MQYHRAGFAWISHDSSRAHGMLFTLRPTLQDTRHHPRSVYTWISYVPVNHADIVEVQPALLERKFRLRRDPSGPKVVRAGTLSAVIRHTAFRDGGIVVIRYV